MKKILIICILIFPVSLFSLTPGDVMDGDMKKKEIPVMQAPTQLGPMLNFSYNLEEINSPLAMNYWAVGPGVFFDLNLGDIVTMSADVFYIFPFSQISPDMYLRTGIYAKKWINKNWGYAGLGLQGNIKKDQAGSDFSLDLTLLLTGESVFLQKGVNSVGDLRVTLALIDPLGGVTVRFQYTLGLGIMLR